MSIYTAMRTSVSGMNGQSNRLATYSENIANVDTVGYKAASAQFSTLLVSQTSDNYTSGGVETHIRYGIDQQGVLQTTTSSTDLAVSGGGFFVVSDANGAQHLTRAGSFILDDDGYLVNTAGYKLQGVDLTGGPAPTSSSGFGGLTDIKINANGLIATASTTASLAANLPAAATAAAAGTLPSDNSASSAATAKASLTAYDSLGVEHTLDIYMTKTSDSTWEVAVYDKSAANSSTSAFPYSSGPLATQTLTFNPTTGALDPSSATSVSVAVPGGNTIPIDLSSMQQLGSVYSISSSSIDGNAPTRFSSVQVSDSGVVSAVYQNGKSVALYQIQLATVPSVNNLTPLSNNIYDVNQDSGGVIVGTPQTGAFGKILSKSLENSTVDIATELTNMIETQRSYTANSKAFTIASDMTDVLVNLKV